MVGNGAPRESHGSILGADGFRIFPSFDIHARGDGLTTTGPTLLPFQASFCLTHCFWLLIQPLLRKAGATVLDRVHQAMILFGAGRGEAMKRFLVEDGVGAEVTAGSFTSRSVQRDTHFASPEAALEHWLAVAWGYEDAEHFERAPKWDPARILMTECAFVVDRKMKRVVFVVSYRWPLLGESRLPVATVLNSYA